MKKHRANTRSGLSVNLVERSSRSSAVRAMKDIGPVVYAIRLGDDVKIGWILAVMPGDLEDEQAIHARLVPFRSRGREYYHQTPEVLAEVNRLRAAVGMESLDTLS
jgi:hypothetical protein